MPALHPPPRPPRQGADFPVVVIRAEVSMGQLVAAAALGAALAWSVQLHIHGSLSEGTGTMTGQFGEARDAGVDVLWWTDHDYYLQPGGDLLVGGFDFDGGSLVVEHPLWPPGTASDLGWNEAGGEALHPLSAVLAEGAAIGEGGWRIELPATPFDDGWQSRRWRLEVRPAVNYRPLLGQVQLSFQVRPLLAASPDAELWICVPLSEVERGVQNEVCFVHGQLDPAALDTESKVHYPIEAPPGAFSEIHYDLSAIARERFPDLGEDQHAELIDVEVRARAGARAAYDLDEFRFEQARTGQDLLDAQRTFLADATVPELVQMVGQEISLIGNGAHLNAFGAAVPPLTYADRDWTLEDAVEWVHDQGGIVSFNHVFGYQVGVTMTPSERVDAVNEAIETLLATAVYGCDLLEVGYREREGELQDFLTVWDALSTQGVVVTGIGSSDLHNPMPWETWTNPFVTWVVAEAPEEGPLLDALARGNAFFGNPHLYPAADVWLAISTTSGAEMGQVVATASGPQEVVIELDPARSGDEVRLVENGVVTAILAVEGDGPFTTSLPVDPTGGNVVRAEVWTEDGEPALFTNPIYFFPAVPEDDIHPGRIFGG